ncbi:LysM peptidoglycan-binding domain-containing protein [Rossellomorea oryzaecorticis]|uniref:LysM peptidoglycan-binding domain-containing protein n=1 Tax=Rossellomorea oryzaecorticis TaxID=1396505 RepID=A0ABW8VKQ9_9BACI|nr:LysM peptidoglycan-binding domain-containing protein [[Bacillus] enclensis]MBH9965342.1 LysM peptidoglycan-binding domain-containing protein [[Bacillus] enclensis]QTC42515.1 LysM peptidoglycan-binding domain-containing protein [Bacillus sp. V3]QWC24608.1 LysM peptidoglycan-binding domain-containing protein [Bacillus haikouensis]
MLTQIWNRFSYIIILFVLSFLSAGYLVVSGGSDPSYETVTVNKGDTLWTIAEKFEGEYNMTREEFIEWVGHENDLISFAIEPGMSLILPVEASSYSTQSDIQLAMNNK